MKYISHQSYFVDTFAVGGHIWLNGELIWFGDDELKLINQTLINDSDFLLFSQIIWLIILFTNVYKIIEK